MLPLILKRKILDDSDFYKYKQLIEMSLVKKSYQVFKENYIACLKVHDPEVYYFENFLDPPFNTIRKIDNREFTDQVDLFDLYNS